MDWKLTRNAIGEPEVDEIHADDGEDLALGYAYLRALAAEQDNPAQITARGYVFRKRDNEFWI